MMLAISKWLTKSMHYFVLARTDTGSVCIVDSSNMIGMCGMDFGSAYGLFEREYAPAMSRRQRDCLRQLAAINSQG